jgi:hypothetical protein
MKSRDARAPGALTTLVAAAWLVAACVESAAPHPHYTHIVSGPTSDTVGAAPTTPMIVEVWHNGAVAANTPVLVLGVPLVVYVYGVTGTFAAGIQDTTDNQGRVTFWVRAGSLTGSAGIAVGQFPAWYDTVTFTVRPGAPAHVAFVPGDTAVFVGGSYALGATTRDRFGNIVNDSVTVTVAPADVCSGTAASVHGSAMGRCSIVGTYKTLVDSAHASFVPNERLAIAYGGVALGLINSDGTGYRQVVALSDQSLSPGWSHGATRIVYYTGDPGASARLHVVDTTGSAIASFGGDTAFSEAFYGRFSPDDQWIYFSAVSPHGSGLWRAHPDGTSASVIIPSGGSFSALPIRVSVSPNGGALVYDNGGFVDKFRLADSSAVILAMGRSGSFSPSGDSVAYYNDDGVAIVDTSGSFPRLVAPLSMVDEWQAPQWTPDGKWLLLHAGDTLEYVRVSDGSVVPIPNSDVIWQAAIQP